MSLNDMNRENNKFLILRDEDGLPCLMEGVQDYTLIRYRIYKVIFSAWTSWWKDRTCWLGYLDLTAGPGYSQTKKLKKVKKQVGASPIIAIETNPPFTYFIFIEKDFEFYCALRERILDRGVKCIIRHGDSNDLVDSALLEMEGHCLACIDPFRPSDIKWATVSRLLREKFCDVVGVLPAPLAQRSTGRFSDRDYIKSLSEHMPPSFNIKDAKKFSGGILKYCRHIYTSYIENELKRHVFTQYLREAKYQVLFATVEEELKEKIKNQVVAYLSCGVLNEY